MPPHTSPHAGGRLSVALVTVGDFAGFLKTERYFRVEFWEDPAALGPEGGDAVLRQIGFCRATADRPVFGLSWYQAAAYCAAAGGRLPRKRELEALFEVLRIGPRAAEWCSDWYHPAADGPDVRPDLPVRKRVVGWTEAGAAPGATGRPFGFRVAYDRAQQRSSLVSDRGHVT